MQVEKGWHPAHWLLLQQRKHLRERVVLPDYNVTKLTCSHFRNETAKKTSTQMNYLQFLTIAQCVCGMEIAVVNSQAFN